MRVLPVLTALVIGAIATCSARGAVTVFFDSSQEATPASSGITSDTISSSGYLFTMTRDKLFTGGIGLPDPIGRTVRVPWPQGLEAQAVTVTPPGVTDHKARIDISRVDGAVFDINSFTARLLANTAGTGGSIEIMPLVDGEDAFSEPVFFDASGIAGNSFSYHRTPDIRGQSTLLLQGYTTYKIGLFVDFAITALTLEGAAVPVPEPGSLALLAVAGAILGGPRRVRRKRRRNP